LLADAGAVAWRCGLLACCRAPARHGRGRYSVFAAISNHYVYVMSFNGKNLVTNPEPIER
jgi:hypothetical protein